MHWTRLGNEDAEIHEAGRCGDLAEKTKPRTVMAVGKRLIG